jgi:hypothetical protein
MHVIGSTLTRAVVVLHGAQINPCNSLLHPAVQAGIQPEGAEELSVQSAYTPKSQCFGCGEWG